MSESVPSLLERGESLFSEGRPEAAASVFEQALERDPRCARAWNDLGASRHALGDLPGAAAAFGAALECEPADADALVNLAGLEAQRGRVEVAAPLLRRALESRPDDAGAQELLPALRLVGPAPPSALLLDWDRTLRDRRGLLRQCLEEAGYAVHAVSRDLMQGLARAWGVAVDDANQRYLALCRPALVLADPGATTALGLDRIEAPPIIDLAELRDTPVPPAPTRTGRPADPDGDLLLSVIVPTHDRRPALQNLLDRLALQDLDPGLFEVIIVDDGSKEPVARWLDPGRTPFRVQILRQENAGPAAARNLALRAARGAYILIYNDDALPARDNCRRHLLHQLSAEAPIAVLGSFDFPEEACRDPFTNLLQHEPLLFEYGLMRPGALHGGRFFWTCNLSVPRACLEAVGGFETSFRHAIWEDVDCGMRLERELGVKVLYDPRIRSLHDHPQSLEGYRKRSWLLGWYQALVCERHPSYARRLTRDRDHLGPGLFLGLRQQLETLAPDVPRMVADVRAAEDAMRGVPPGPERARLRSQLARAVVRLRDHDIRRGMCVARWGEGFDAPRPKGVLARGTTSVIIPNLNGLPHVRGCLDSLRAETEGSFEIIVADNGSTDGSLEWLREQPDVRLIEMGTNAGAPAARNAALEVATGNTVLFCDNDVIFTPGWRPMLLRHLDAWPDIGVVGPMSDYVSGPQKTREHERTGEDLAAFARRFSTEHAREHLYAARLILFFMICRREVIDSIGGIDTRYGRWGFEDDDFSLRALRAGFQLRIAQDCFIRHLGSRTSKTANLDYRRLLLENWEVFKRKWGLDPALPYGTSYETAPILALPPDPARDHVPLGAAAATC